MTSQDFDFTDDFCSFLRAAVPSMDAAELLLFLARESTRDLSAAGVISALGACYADAAHGEALRNLESFRARGLIVAHADGRVRYQPASAALSEHVSRLERLHRERPVRVIFGERPRRHA